MARSPKKLVDLEIEAVAGVDKAANRRKFLVIKRAGEEPRPTFLERISALFKQEYGVDPAEMTPAETDALLDVMAKKNEGPEKGDGTVSNLDELLKGASQELQEAVKAAFAERDAKIETLEKQIEKSQNANPDEINKADLPEPIRKRLEDLEKQAREAEEIAKAEREARVKAEINKRAESYANVGEVEKIAAAIYKAQGVSEEFASELEELFKAAHERIAKGDLFKEIGHGGTGGSLSDDPASQFAELVEKAAEANNLSYGEAARKVAKEHPHLAAAYDSAVPVGKN